VGSEMCIRDSSIGGWYTINLPDSGWEIWDENKNEKTSKLQGFPQEVISTLYFSKDNNIVADSKKVEHKIYCRRSFNLDKAPNKITLYLAGKGKILVYFNEDPVVSDISSFSDSAIIIDLTPKNKIGKNVLAIKLEKVEESNVVLYCYIVISSISEEILLQPYGFEKQLSLAEVNVNNYKFPEIKNFEITREE
ncbi:MAG: hypothetical protein N2053_08810, partial [Chitinispirillaceae bacterium]|nr:hypothetical protein [Chitinispirillaceae bacterium]